MCSLFPEDQKGEGEDYGISFSPITLSFYETFGLLFTSSGALRISGIKQLREQETRLGVLGWVTYAELKDSLLFQTEKGRSRSSKSR